MPKCLFFFSRFLRTDVFLDSISLGSSCAQQITESLGLLYRIALGVTFGNAGGGITVKI